MFSMPISVDFASFLSHEGHALPATDNFKQIMQWLGYFHLVFLHFPIALIVMTAISEIFFWLSQNVLFAQAARFMIVAAAIAAIPTTLFGFFLAYNAQYEGMLFIFFWWHRFLGVFITLLAILTAVLNEGFYRKAWNVRKVYFICWIVLFISVNVTGFLGGGMTFGIEHLLPP